MSILHTRSARRWRAGASPARISVGEAGCFPKIGTLTTFAKVSAGETPAGRTGWKAVLRLFPADLAAFVLLFEPAAHQWLEVIHHRAGGDVFAGRFFQNFAPIFRHRWVTVESCISFARGFCGGVVLRRYVGDRLPLCFAVHAKERLIAGIGQF